MKWLALVAAIFMTAASVELRNGSVGGAAGGLYVAFAVLHVWDRWVEWSASRGTDEARAQQGKTPESTGPKQV